MRLRLILVITILYSRYWPPLGGTNCSHFVEGQCLSRMASGYRWQDWVGIAAACPPEWPFGTQVVLNDRTWICLDRGGKVKNNWVDFLSPSSEYRYGSTVTVTVFLPGEGFVLSELLQARMKYLSSSEINAPEPDHYVNKLFEAIGVRDPSESGVGIVEPDTDNHRESDSSVSFERRQGYPKISLYERLDLGEPFQDERSIQDPINCYHRQRVCQYDFQ